MSRCVFNELKKIEMERDLIKKQAEKINLESTGLIAIVSGSADFQVGDKVKINPETIPDYFEEDCNPMDLVGTVVEVHNFNSACEYDIYVEFSSGEVNSYEEDHLIKQG